MIDKKEFYTSIMESKQQNQLTDRAIELYSTLTAKLLNQYRNKHNFPDHILDDCYSTAMYRLVCGFNNFDHSKSHPGKEHELCFSYFYLMSSRAISKTVGKEIRYRSDLGLDDSTDLYNEGYDDELTGEEHL